ncbi:hypothetical protein B0H10DRAFT_1956619 [Mycena sp. CBHHK59/15]|nr:hypothetical protein B0H10DRAFT_1956619 [Mycena sp. CBHHK59/15]
MVPRDRVNRRRHVSLRPWQAPTRDDQADTCLHIVLVNPHLFFPIFSLPTKNSNNMKMDDICVVWDNFNLSTLLRVADNSSPSLEKLQDWDNGEEMPALEAGDAVDCLATEIGQETGNLQQKLKSMM